MHSSLTRTFHVLKGLSSVIFWAFFKEHPAMSVSSSIDAVWKKLRISDLSLDRVSSDWSESEFSNTFTKEASESLLSSELRYMVLVTTDCFALLWDILVLWRGLCGFGWGGMGSWTTWACWQVLATRLGRLATVEICEVSSSDSTTKCTESNNYICQLGHDYAASLFYLNLNCLLIEVYMVYMVEPSWDKILHNSVSLNLD